MNKKTTAGTADNPVSVALGTANVNIFPVFFRGTASESEIPVAQIDIKDVDPAKQKWQYRDNLVDGSPIIDADN